MSSKAQQEAFRRFVEGKLNVRIAFEDSKLYLLCSETGGELEQLALLSSAWEGYKQGWEDSFTEELPTLKRLEVPYCASGGRWAFNLPNGHTVTTQREVDCQETIVAVYGGCEPVRVESF